MGGRETVTSMEAPSAELSAAEIMARPIRQAAGTWPGVGDWHTVWDDDLEVYEVQFKIFSDGTLRLLRKRTDKTIGRVYDDGWLWLNPPFKEARDDDPPAQIRGYAL